MDNKDKEAIILITIIATLSYAYSCSINNKPFLGFDLGNLRTNNYTSSIQSDNIPQNVADNKRSINNLEKTLYKEINIYRVENGLNELKLDNRISQIAKNHSFLMLEREQSIGNANIKESSKLINEFMPYKSIGKAVSYSFGHYNPARTTADSWISDPRFITTLKGKYEYTGIGVVRSVTGEYYFTQIFVNPL